MSQPGELTSCSRHTRLLQCRLIGGKLVNLSVDVYIAMELAAGGDLFHLRGQMSGEHRGDLLHLRGQMSGEHGASWRMGETCST